MMDQWFGPIKTKENKMSEEAGLTLTIRLDVTKANGARFAHTEQGYHNMSKQQVAEVENLGAELLTKLAKMGLQPIVK